jgi:hypothetical protein
VEIGKYDFIGTKKQTRCASCRAKKKGNGRRLFLDRGRPSRGLSRLSHTELGIDFGPAE